MLLDANNHNAKEERTDEEILALSMAQPHLFSVLVERYEDAFLRKAQSILGEREVAEDVVQETFTKIYVHGKRFKSVSGASFSSWAYKILMNTSRTRYRKRKLRYERTALIQMEQYEALPDKTDYEELHTLQDYVASLLSRVPTEMARVLTMRFLEGKSNAEIAESEGATEGAIKTRVYRAKQTLKDAQRVL